MAFPDHHDDLLAEAQMGFPHRGGTHTELCPPLFFPKGKNNGLKIITLLGNFPLSIDEHYVM